MKKELLIVDIDMTIADLTDKQRMFIDNKNKKGLSWHQHYYPYLKDQKRLKTLEGSYNWKFIQEFLQKICDNGIVKKFYDEIEVEPAGDLIFNTSRSDKYRNETFCWLKDKFKKVEIIIDNQSRRSAIEQYPLLMRKEGDYRKSWKVKQDNLPAFLSNYDSVLFLEDDPDCIKMYKQHGFTQMHPTLDFINDFRAKNK